jgi:hypothetical protein
MRFVIEESPVPPIKSLNALAFSMSAGAFRPAIETMTMGEGRSGVL